MNGVAAAAAGPRTETRYQTDYLVMDRFQLHSSEFILCSAAVSIFRSPKLNFGNGAVVAIIDQRSFEPGLTGDVTWAYFIIMFVIMTTILL